MKINSPLKPRLQFLDGNQVAPQSVDSNKKCNQINISNTKMKINIDNVWFVFGVNVAPSCDRLRSGGMMNERLC